MSAPDDDEPTTAAREAALLLVGQRHSPYLRSALDVACPACKAPIGRQCARSVYPQGARLTNPHKARKEAVRV